MMKALKIEKVPETYKIIIVLGIISSTFIGTTYILNLLSRQFEFQADNFVLKNGLGQQLINLWKESYMLDF